MENFLDCPDTIGKAEVGAHPVARWHHVNHGDDGGATFWVAHAFALLLLGTLATTRPPALCLAHALIQDPGAQNVEDVGTQLRVLDEGDRKDCLGKRGCDTKLLAALIEWRMDEPGQMEF
jgi:hypothetical protein